MPPSAFATLASISALRGAFSAATKLLAKVVTSTPEPAPNVLTILLAAAMLAEASLSFLGLGIQPPNPSWGAMLARAYQSMELAPEQMLAPGFAILLTAMAFNSLGEALRKELDPTSRKE